MIDQNIIDAIRAEAETSMPALVLIRLKELNEGDLGQFRMIALFKEAFPEIPLSIVNEASTSQIVVGKGGLNDSEINDLLGRWIPRTSIAS